ncbi:APC family permease [Ornithinimicrobium pekingense]|uniref:Amino acid transporter n=1 Tax=Ornithinimicrobium pekingense TaxID=384677 RepID=A0ABQ2FCM1_9MICO|nr:APC family permease [Ornithinimicrobium pekingense]GGK76039.1 amino acid transporter [Ornithinimicrobium pekingense]
MTTGRLRRTLGLRDAVTVGLGSMVGAGVFAVWGPAAGAAGGWVLAALVLAAVVATCNALSSAALAVRHPSAGGTYVYGRERLGEVWGYLAGWCFVVGKTASCAAMAMTVGAYLAPGAERVTAVVAVLLVTGLNLAGVQRSVSASRVIVSVVLCALLGVAVAAVRPRDGGMALDPTQVAGGEVDAYGVLQAAGLLFFAFAGYARIATLGEEVRRPERVIPRAVVLALAAVLVLYAGVALLVLGVLGPERVASSPAAVADTAAEVWDPAWVWTLRVAAGLAALGALLNLVLGISRTAMAMARDGHLPGGLARVSGSGAVPRAAEAAVGVVVLLVVLVVDLRGAIGFSSFGVLLYYAVANAAAFTLRREWAPGQVVPVVGLVGCLALAVSLPGASVLGGSAVVLAGLATYGLRRRHRDGGAAA